MQAPALELAPVPAQAQATALVPVLVRAFAPTLALAPVPQSQYLLQVNMAVWLSKCLSDKAQKP